MISNWEINDVKFKDFLIFETKTNQDHRIHKDDSVAIGFGMTAGQKGNTPDYTELSTIVFDLDKIPEDQIAKMYELFKNDPYVYVVYLTHSGLGFRVIFNTEKATRNKDHYKNTLIWFVQDFEVKYNTKIMSYLDKSKLYGTSCWFLGNKTDWIHINEDSMVYPLFENPVIDVEKEEKNKKNIQNNRTLLLDALKKIDLSEYDKWLRIGIALFRTEFTKDDFKSISYQDEKTIDFIDMNWEGFDSYDGDNVLGIGTIIYYIRQEFPEFKMVFGKPSLVSITGNSIFKYEDYTITPMYKYENEGIVYKFQISKGDNMRTLEIKGSTFGDSKSIMTYFRENDIYFRVRGQDIDELFKALSENSTHIKKTQVGFYSDSIVGFNYIYDGKIITENKDGLFDHDNSSYIIACSNKDELMASRNYLSEYVPDFNSFKKFAKLFEVSYKNKYKICLILSYLIAVMMRDSLLDYFKDFPILGLIGAGRTGKSSILEIISEIFNITIIYNGTVPNFYRRQADYLNSVVLVDELKESDENENLGEFLKNSTRNHTRERQRNGVVQYNWRNSLIFTSNKAITNEAVYSRIINIKFSQDDKGTAGEFVELNRFVKENAMSILFDMFDLLKKIDLDALQDKVFQTKVLLNKTFKDDRLSEIYAILLEVAEMTGIIEILEYSREEIIDNLSEQLSHRNNTTDMFVNIVREYVSCHIYPDKKVVSDQGIFISDFSIKKSNFAKFIQDNNYFQFTSVNSLTKDLSNFDWVKNVHKNDGDYYLFVADNLNKVCPQIEKKDDYKIGYVKDNY